jgi:hypothetical protein
MQAVRVALTSVLLDDCQDIVPRSVPTGCSVIVGSDIANASPSISQITVGDHEKYKSGGRGAPLQGCPFQAPRAWKSPRRLDLQWRTNAGVSLCRLRDDPYYFLAGYRTTP